MNTKAFHDFERAGWERAAEFYGDAFGVVTVQTAEALLDAAGVRSGSRVLDVACGPGFVASPAAARGADVTGLDFSAAMIAEARRRHPSIAFRDGDAESLPFGAASFDAIVMNFGLLHLARPDTAIAQAHGALRPGGRYALTVWASPDRAVGFGMVLKAIEAHGTTKVPLPEGPPFFRFSDQAEFRRSLETAGFQDVSFRELPITWTVSSPEVVFEAMSRGGVRTAAVLRAQTPEALAKIRDDVLRSVETFAKDGKFVIPMPAILASGCRAGL
jgi:SAM-dependent methyltransferase